MNNSQPAMRSLHITNGDIAATLIKQIMRRDDEVIAWQDVLFEGPVTDVPLNQLSIIRANYLSEAGYGDFKAISREFLARNSTVESYPNYSEIILWFEHDLYDQLQLLQILDWFSNQKFSAKDLKLICIGDHPNVNPFLGFGQLAVKDMAELLPNRKVVGNPTLQLGKKAWQAFCDVTPQLLESVLMSDLSALPFLKNALIRHFEEYPSTINGLSRTEQYILASVNHKQTHLNKIFEYLPANEGKYFMGMGDVSFWAITQRLANNEHPLITIRMPEKNHREDMRFMFENAEIKLTKLGETVLSGKKNWIAINGINRWLGGVHLTSDRFWCWDNKKQKIVSG